MSVGSCYTDRSRFSSIEGHMDLKNVHKHSEVHLPDGGSLTMTGVDGNLTAKTSNGRVYIQLSRLIGTSTVDIARPEHAVVNLAENIDKECSIVANAYPITIDDALVSLQGKVVAEGGYLESRIEKTDVQTDVPILIINCTGPLRLGKESWIDTIRLQTK